MITASNFRELEKNSLRGFVDLTLAPSGLVLRQCSYHVREDGRRWVGMPGRPLLYSDGRHLRDSSGKGQWVPVIEIPDKAARKIFQDAALAAIDALLGRGQP
jgi:hypothetical protein